MWNASVQQSSSVWVATLSYAGARGTHLRRNSDVTVTEALAMMEERVLGRRPPASQPKLLRHELKSSDGDSCTKRSLSKEEAVEQRAAGQSGKRGRGEDTEELDVFSDSTTATTSANPEFTPGYNKGLRI